MSSGNVPVYRPIPSGERQALYQFIADRLQVIARERPLTGLDVNEALTELKVELVELP